MWLNLKILWWSYFPPPTNVFVSRVQKWDNETLMAFYCTLKRVIDNDAILAFTWRAQMKSIWMLGVLERELVVRGFTLEQ